VRAERLTLALALALVSCAPATACPEPVDALVAARAYVADACVRREAMEASVAAADTPYGRLRLDHYALSGAGVIDDANDWDALPVLTRRVRRLRVDDGTAPDSALEEGPVIDSAPSDLASYVAAGQRAFERFPIQIDLGLAPLRDRATAERIGLIVSEGGLVRGAIEAETATGWTVSLTCAACHARNVDDAFVLGVPNERIDLGSLYGHDDWPVGTMDVTDDGITNPIRPSDLRPIASQARLQHTGNLFNGRIARMVRIETLMIGQLSGTFRPDREVVASIALFLEAEGDALPRPDRALPGATMFEASCAGCHRGDALAGPPVPVDVVGTDPIATTGGQRGTGAYRAPSLLGVGDRRGVLHDGSAVDLRAVLQLDPSEHVGHPFGLERSTDEREAIAAYLDPR
jgi:mono/diheme cytochrome c family protein